MHGTMALLIDHTHEASFEQIQEQFQQERFTAIKHNFVDVGIETGAVWVRFELINPLDQPQTRFLQLNNALIDRVDLHGLGKVAHSGEAKPYLERDVPSRYPTFRIELLPQQSGVFYVRYRDVGPVPFRADLYRPDEYMAHSMRQRTLLGIYFGVMLVMVLYNLFLYFSVRERAYLYYICYVACFAALIAQIEGVLQINLGLAGHERLSNQMILILGILCLVMLTQFCRSFLLLKKYSPRIHQISRWFLVWLGLLLIPILLLDFAWPARLLLLSVVLTCLMVVTTGILCWRRGYLPARFFLLAFFTLALGAGLWSVMILGLLERNFLTDNLMPIGSTFEVILLSLALADRINLLKREHEQMREAALIHEKENARNLEIMVRERTRELEQNFARVKRINSVAEEVRKSLDVQKTSELFIRKAVELIRPEGSGSILLYHPADNSLWVYAHHNLNPEYFKRFRIEVHPDKLYSYDVLVNQQSKIFHYEFLEKYQNESTRKLHFGKTYRQQLVTPIVSEGKSIGLVNFTLYEDHNGFTENEKELLHILTQSLSSHFEHAQLYENLKVTKRELEEVHTEIMNDLNMAAEMQKAMIRPPLEFPYINMALRYHPWSGVSGDMYEVYTNRERDLNFFLGDATGHGIGAAFITMLCKMGLQTIKPFLTPDETIRQLNRLMVGCLQETKFMTGMFIRVTSKGEMGVSNAGHPPLHLVTEQGTKIEMVSTSGLALAMFPEEELPFETATRQLKHGDRLVIYTDGIIEARSAQQKLFGIKRINQYLEENAHLNIHDLADGLLQWVDEFAEGGTKGDDVTLVIIEYNDPQISGVPGNVTSTAEAGGA